MTHHNHKQGCCDHRGPCGCLPSSVRMNYFYGQLISERDLLTEQAYFRDKLRHAHRCVHGYGVICGMIVVAVEPPKECLPADSAERKRLREAIARGEKDLRDVKLKLDAERDDATCAKLNDEYDRICAEVEDAKQRLDAFEQKRPDRHASCDDLPQLHRVRVTCGAAIDCDGNDVILVHDRIVDVWALLTPSERDRLADGCPTTVNLSVCYEECGREPVRPLALDACATTTGCELARIAEGARITASLTPPKDDERCEPCCTCCDEPCLLLATIELSRDEPIGDNDIDNGARRRFGLYEDTVITGINWVQGATYSADVANALIGRKDATGGIEITFSRGIHVSTVVRGTVEICVASGGGGRAGYLNFLDGEFVDLPADGMVDRIRYRNMTGERVQEGDRIIVIVHAPFLLDRCCRPVAGLHVGGRLPRLVLDTDPDKAAREEEAKAGVPDHKVCLHPPRGPMAWTSEGHGNFESWFWVDEK